MSNSRIMMLVVVILLAVALLFLGSLLLGTKQKEMPKLFSVDLSYQAGLDNKYMTPALRQKFGENSIFLSEPEYVKISIRTKDSQWQIKDKLDEDKNYIVRKEDGTLNIYSSKEYSHNWTKVLKDLLD